MTVCLRQADDAVFRWLNRVRLDRYYQLFAAAGYDLPTVSRMTPEVRLTARFSTMMYLWSLFTSPVVKIPEVKNKVKYSLE